MRHKPMTSTSGSVETTCRPPPILAHFERVGVEGQLVDANGMSATLEPLAVGRTPRKAYGPANDMGIPQHDVAVVALPINTSDAREIALPPSAISPDQPSRR